MGYRGWLPPSTNPKDEAGNLNIPCLQSGYREERDGLADNRHLHAFAASLCVTVGGALVAGCRPPLTPMSGGGLIVVGVRESCLHGEGGQGSPGPPYRLIATARWSSGHPFVAVAR